MRERTKPTHCWRKHEFTSDNTYYNSRGARVCRACSAMHKAKWVLNNPIERSRAHRRYAWKHQGIINFSTDDYETMHKQQKGLCKICDREIRLYGTGRLDVDAHVDHEKSTGVVRGLLCRRCNLGIGFLGDGAVGVSSALNYLEKEYGGLESGCM